MERRVFDREDLEQIATMLETVYDEEQDLLHGENVSEHYLPEDVEKAVKVLKQIAAGMCWDDAIIADGQTTYTEHGAVADRDENEDEED